MAEEAPKYCALAGLIHVVGLAENTLCGMALEGVEFGGSSMAVVPQKVGCEQCAALIEYIKRVPNKYHRERKRPVSKNRFDSYDRGR